MLYKYFCLTFGCVAWKSRQVEQFLIAFIMSLLKVTQHINSHASNWVFGIPTWFMCSCLRTHSCREAGLMTLLLFIVIPSITAISTWNGQYDLISALTTVLVDDNPIIIYALSAFNRLSTYVVCLISSA